MRRQSSSGHPDDLLLATGSVDNTGTYVFEVEPEGIGPANRKQLAYWTTADGFDTMYSLWNPTSQAEDLTMTFYYGDGSGSYVLPVHLAANGSTMVDVMMLIESRQPDANGEVFPMTETRGSAIIRNTVKGTVPGFETPNLPLPLTLVTAGGTFSVQTATCGVVCITCCGQSVPSISPNPIDCPVAESMQCSATTTDCNGGVLTPSVTWSSSDTSIMTVDSSGVVTGMAAGSCTITAQFASNVVVNTGQICSATNPSCQYGRPAGSATATVISVSQSPASLNMSTGDTKSITVSVSPSSTTVTTSFAGTDSTTSNPDSSCGVTLSIPGATGSGSIASNVTASPSGCSGVFNVKASASGASSSNSTAVNVPPQVLIQMMEAEAGGTGNNTAMQSLGDVAQNRIHSSIFDPPYSDYQNTIVSGQFAIGSATTGIQPELSLSVNVFTGSAGRFCNALAFWTPTSTQWTVVQNAINNPSSTFPTGTGAPTFSSWPQSNQQILYVSAVGLQSNGAPNFLYLVYRSSNQNSAISASCSP